MGVEQTVQVAVRVPERVVKELEAIAESDDRTLSYVVRQALRSYIETQPQKAS